MSRDEHLVGVLASAGITGLTDQEALEALEQVLRGDSARRSWSPAGRALAGHDISALSWDARAPDTLLVGTAAGALLRSKDGGTSRERTGAGLPEAKIWSITPDPHAPPGALYAGMDGGHLFRSGDGGASTRKRTVMASSSRVKLTGCEAGVARHPCGSSSATSPFAAPRA